MQIVHSRDDITSVRADGLLLLVPDFDWLNDPILKKINGAIGNALENLLETEEFTGKEGQLTTLYQPTGFKAKRLILIGLGSKSKIDADSFRRAMGRAARYRGLNTCTTAAVYFGTHQKGLYYQAVVEGYRLGAYKMLAYKTGEAAQDNNRLKKLIFIADNARQMQAQEKAAERGSIIAEGQLLGRDLSGTPSNFLTPKILAQKATQLAKKFKFSCQVLDEAAIKKEKMGALWSVAKGSVEPPRFIVCCYNGGPAKQKPIVLVGKGVMFDSGGISLKPGLNMHEMKQDMTGAAVVLGTIVTAARLGVKRNVVALIPSVENMPSGGATKPGDIITSRKGLTVEIINTDAEGRMILADALDYANKFDPQAVIDMATLTGAAKYILGYAGAPIMGNRSQLLAQIEAASDATAELVWSLPIWDEHREQMKSPIADLHNSGGAVAGTIAAGAFLENFIGDWPWAHIDIAYMDAEPKGRPYIPKGASGWGVRMMTELLSSWKKV